MFHLRSKVVWQESAPHVLLLSKFKSAREDYSEGRLGGHDWEEWEEVLNESPRKAMKRFLKDGVLEQASLEGCLAYKFKVPELKAMLKRHGLSMSGRKADLIDRLIEADPQGMKKAVSGLSLLQCSEQGQEIVERYEAAEREKRVQLEQSLLNALQQHEFRKAVELRVSYEAEQIFPSGLGIDWQDYPFNEHDVGMIESIFTRKPRVMAHLSDEQLEPLRVGAGMIVLGWTPSQMKKWLPSDLDNGLHVSNWGAALMLHSHAHYLREMRQARKFQNDGVFQYEVSIETCNDDYVCDACRRIASRKYTVEVAPELPYEKCTSEDGCRCAVGVRPIVPD